MSRLYKLNVEVKGISEARVYEVLVGDLGWEESDTHEYKDIVYFEGDGSLCGGQSEDEAHEEIVAKLKEVNKDVLVLTRWTYMEDLPYQEYGSLDVV